MNMELVIIILGIVVIFIIVFRKYFSDDSKYPKLRCNAANMPSKKICKNVVCVHNNIGGGEVWKCLEDIHNKKCLPNKTVDCPEGFQPQCIDGEWQCVSTCDPSSIIECPEGEDVICVGGTWQCSSNQKSYTGSIIDTSTQISTMTSGMMTSQQYDSSYVPDIIYFDDNTAIVIDAHDTSYKNDSNSGFVYNGGFYLDSTNKYYSQFTWDTVKNPSPVVSLDLYSQEYYDGQDSTNDNVAIDIVLIMFDPLSYNSNTDSIEYVAYTKIYSGTWGSIKNIINQCGYIINSSDFLSEKWIVNPNINLSGSIDVGFCLGFFSDNEIQFFNSYTSQNQMCSINEIFNNHNQNNGNSLMCSNKGPYSFNLYNFN